MDLDPQGYFHIYTPAASAHQGLRARGVSAVIMSYVSVHEDYDEGPWLDINDPGNRSACVNVTEYRDAGEAVAFAALLVEMAGKLEEIQAADAA